MMQKKNNRPGIVIAILVIPILLITGCNKAQEIKSDNKVQCPAYLKLQTNDETIDKAFRIALGDFFTNVQDFRIPILDMVAPVILAGIEYNSPWTRDAAINCWNAGSFMLPEVARNSLLTRVTQRNDSLMILDRGNYWDAIIWSTGAWNHYLCTGDREFLDTALEVTRNTLAFYERTEYNENYGLFRGLAWSDGVAAYEGKYANTGGSSAAIDWVKYNPDKISTPGFGIPMMATYTNCLYYNAYLVAYKMEKEINKQNSGYLEKAEDLKQAINKYLWNEETGLYKFYIDEEEESNLQTAYGDAFAVLFGVADEKKASSIFKNHYVAPAGIPCGWPPLERYHADEHTFPRHNAVVWPQIQGFWAEAAARYKKSDLLWHELSKLAENAVRDMQFSEIYHPFTGERYGGMQEGYKEDQGKILLWHSTNRQTWAATAYIRMVIYGLLGVNTDNGIISFSPCIPEDLSQVELSNLSIRNMNFHVKVTGSGTQIGQVSINGKTAPKPEVSASSKGNYLIEIKLK